MCVRTDNIKAKEQLQKLLFCIKFLYIKIQRMDMFKTWIKNKNESINACKSREYT